jgi:hypothetical protein
MKKNTTTMCGVVALMTMLVALDGCASPSSRAVSSAEPASPTITVAAALNATNTIVLTVTGPDGNPCTTTADGHCCQSTGPVTFDWQTNERQYLFVTNVNGTVSAPPPTANPTAAAPIVVNFGVVAAATGAATTVLDWDDPKITVKTGGCGGDDILPL